MKKHNNGKQVEDRFNKMHANFSCKCVTCVNFKQSSCVYHGIENDHIKLIEKNKLLNEILIEQRHILGIDVESLKTLKKAIIGIVDIDYGSFNRAVKAIERILDNLPGNIKKAD
ncbi:MAG: hypothetical protein KJN62_01490 [Deltaproteobacteria bacterium]|nr:hypothetical protein [Deltaproteobacteria bacterium]